MKYILVEWGLKWVESIWNTKWFEWIIKQSENR